MTKRRAFACAPPPSRSFRGRNFARRKTSPQDTVRSSAAWVVENTLASRSPSSVYLESALRRCDSRDHGLLRELSLGTLRWLRFLDHVITSASHRSFSKIEKDLHSPLRIAAYQLLFLNRIPSHAVVHEAVEEARRRTHRGGASFANAVLRRIARDRDRSAWPVEIEDPVRRLAIETSHPDLLVRRWLERFDLTVVRGLLEANNRPKALQLLAFRDRGGREALAEELIDAGCVVEPSRLSPQGLTVRSGDALASKPFREGLFYVQDEASQAAAMIPPPQPGERIWDCAAAPGGKSFTVLAMEPAAKVVLGDVALERLGRLRSNLRRLGRPLPMLVADAGAGPFGAAFDRVILDLPCTGTGTLRKNPELKWRISEEEIERIARLAGRLLAGAASRVAPGGLLVAITCSLEFEENEGVVEGFLKRHEDFTLLPLEGVLDPPLAEHIRGPGFWRILPDGDHDGFTVHVLKKLGDGA